MCAKGHSTVDHDAIGLLVDGTGDAPRTLMSNKELYFLILLFSLVTFVLLTSTDSSLAIALADCTVSLPKDLADRGRVKLVLALFCNVDCELLPLKVEFCFCLLVSHLGWRGPYPLSPPVARQTR